MAFNLMFYDHPPPCYHNHEEAFKTTDEYHTPCLSSRTTDDKRQNHASLFR